MPPAKKKPEPEVDTETPSPADAAAVEVAAESDAEASWSVPFRGKDYKVPVAVARSAQFQMGMRAGSFADMLFAAIGPQQAAAFLQALKYGDDIDVVAVEFFDALNAAAGTGNS